MKSILFIVNTGKISSNSNGGAAVYFSHLELLHTLGYSIYLLALEWNNNEFKLEDYAEVENLVSKIDCLKVSNPTIKKTIFKKIKEAVFFPDRYEYSFINAVNQLELKTAVSLSPSYDLIWCEWRWAALLVKSINTKLPVLYSHHDWEYKLAKLRGKLTLKKRFHNFQKKRSEISLVKTVAACVSGSYSESVEIEQISNKKVLYLPTTYTNIASKLIPNQPVNIVHLGGMSTTANRLGLERFLQVCWPEIKRKIPNLKLKVIGSLKGTHENLKTLLIDENIECLGFVKDLDSVLHPKDMHIIPWEFNTGTRTRLPVGMNYSQVMIATKASVGAFPELVNNENIILCDRLEDMSNAIVNLYSDKEKLSYISKNGKKTFMNNFTVESQSNRLKLFLDKII